MHLSALEYGKKFFETYASASFRRVLDIGALDINGSLRSVCPETLEYTGIDLEAGKGVDLVLEDPYSYPFPDGHFDMVVSTSCFEHDSLFWITFLEAARVLAPGGVLYINAPSNGFYHAHPVDNWRFYPDAGLSLQQWGRRSGVAIELLESFIAERDHGDFWNDCVMIFRKPNGSPLPAQFISQSVKCTNIRQIGHGGLISAVQFTEDMRLLEANRAEIASLKRPAAATEPVPRAAPERHPGPPAGPAAKSFWCYGYNNNPALSGAVPLTIFVVAYQRPDPLLALVHSLQAQTSRDFHVVVMHDGPDFEMLKLLSKLSNETKLSFEFRFSATRHNDYGHSLREQAIKECGTEFILLTNDDNYYIPRFIEYMFTAIRRDNLDLAICDMVHSHDNAGLRGVPGYQAFITGPSATNADIGCFIVRGERARRVGWRSKHAAGDGVFIDDLVALGPDLLRWGKVDKILFVHN